MLLFFINEDSPGKPTIQKTSNPQTDENITVILQCNMNARLPGLPIPSIEWLWSSNSCKTKSSDLITPIPFKPKFSDNEDQLLINLTDTFVDGFYYCLVQNDYGNAISDPVSITVQGELIVITIYKLFNHSITYGKHIYFTKYG
ncbi:unnamed protein product [Schistosoma mattheei]|uniref:Uncharacterized protein n=1 Tax=Schistosoma mattheei TaxID=31246 RepID=A0A183Q4V7_9TREM|nr:unnamed protein product [Schistosoma mattheei]